MDERARFDALLVLIEELVERNQETPILVEGRRDVAALRALGCRGSLVQIHCGEPLGQVAERVAGSTREVILLTDWDRSGEEFFTMFRAMLTHNAVRCDGSFRDRIPSYARLAFKDVESLPQYVARGLNKFHRKELEEHAADLAGDVKLVGDALATEFPPQDLPPSRRRRGKVT